MEQQQGPSGHVTRLMLLTLQEVSGPQYAHILQQGGIQRFLTVLPPASDSPALTPEELVRLTHVIWAMLGESLFRLFQRNMGTKLGRRMLEGPWRRQVGTEVPSLAPDAQLRWALERYLTLVDQGLTAMRLEETPDAWTVRMAPCAACLGLSGAQAPICMMPLLMIRQALEALLDRRVRVEETACHAMGAAACTFTVYK
jgi:predicted hydrocarbon binding protein